jgi:glyoxylate reductase
MPAKPVVLVTRRLPQAALARLAEACEVRLHEADAPLPRDDLLRSIRGADALLCLLTDTVDAAVMDAGLPSLKVIANYAVGYDNIDVEAATRRRLPVTNTPGVLTEATADLTFALILDAVRRVTEGDRIVRAGRFPGWSPLYLLGGEVSGATLGLFGCGRIGQAVARRARGFGMRLLYHQRTRLPPQTEADLGLSFVSFDALLAESDIVSVHAPLTSETRHRFTLREFRAMKRTAVFVNTARGPIVKEDDLVTALREELLAGAGLDVYEREPETAPGLAACERAVLAPHLGSATRVTRERMAHAAVDNVLAVLGGARPPACVNPAVFD